MTGCDTTTLTFACPQPAVNADPLPTAPQDVTALVLDRSDKAKYTTNQETDARTAMSRALKEYLEQILLELPGRQVYFGTVRTEFAEPEDGASYPAACCYAIGPQTYDAPGLTPGIKTTPLGNGRFIVHASDLVIKLRAEVFATDKAERMGVIRSLERAFYPVDFINGFRLAMPHYFGARAEFSMRSASYDDDEASAIRRYRRATLTLEARGPVLNLGTYAPSAFHIVVTGTQGDRR